MIKRLRVWYLRRRARYDEGLAYKAAGIFPERALYVAERAVRRHEAADRIEGRAQKDFEERWANDGGR